jgi:hypothetical protein
MNKNRKAEVFLTPSLNWLIMCYVDNNYIQETILNTEEEAEIYADNWVFKQKLATHIVR